MCAERDGWVLKEGVEIPSGRATPIPLVPVLRLSTDGNPALGETAASKVSQALVEVARRIEATEVQLDFDCPDRRLAEYAEFLAKCRARIAPLRLSATALAGWSKLQAFGKLQDGVDLLMPMFYDLAADSPSQVRAGKVLPLVNEATTAQQIESWKSCRTPWFAGLPNFARVTVFDRAGVSRGHLRAWDWEGVCFDPVLTLCPQRAPGVTLLRAKTNTVIANTPIAADETIACRLPDREHLALVIARAEKAGARGVAIFRLPGEGAQTAWSLRQLTTLLQKRAAGVPEFKVRRIPHGLELINASESDLSPRLAGEAGPLDRGWQVEVESNAGAVFREASPGEFANVFGHTDPDAAEPKPVPIPLAQRLTYWFAALRAGESRQSGLIQLAPGVDAASLRWRVPGSPRNTEWQLIE